MGLRSAFSSEEWTDEEKAIVKKGIEDNLSFRKISEYLPSRSINGVKTMAKKLGLKRDVQWKPEEIDYVKAHYKDTPTKEIAKTLGRSCTAVKVMSQKLGVKKDNECTRWDDDMVNYLKNHYFIHDRNEISRVLGVKPQAVTTKAYMLGLCKR